MDHAIGIVTKGILSDSLSTKGFVLLYIEETPLRTRKGVGVQGLEKPKKRVTIHFSYNDVVYEYKVIVNSDMKINVNDIEIYTEHGIEKPKIKFNIE